MAKIGRPTLTDEQLGELFGALIPLVKGTAEFRQKRRVLAIQYQRTERAIDDLFEKARKKFAPAVASPGSDTPLSPADNGGGAQVDDSRRGAA